MQSFMLMQICFLMLGIFLSPFPQLRDTAEKGTGTQVLPTAGSELNIELLLRV